MPYDGPMDVSAIIERLGGTGATAELCEIKPPSVSEWKANNRIPKARELFLRVVRPDAFADLQPPPSDPAPQPTQELSQ